MSDDLLDVLAFGAHPDDIEMTAGGLLCKLVDSGLAVGIVDLTRGELGTRGTAEIRDKGFSLIPALGDLQHDWIEKTYPEAPKPSPRPQGTTE